jgi:hypothetical protein
MQSIKHLPCYKVQIYIFAPDAGFKETRLKCLISHNLRGYSGST